MNKYSYSLLACFALLSIGSCKKKHDAPTPVHPIDSVVVYDDYMALKPGNYWIYEHYKLDSIKGAANALGIYDTTYVVNDTVINGNTYHQFYDVFYGGSTVAAGHVLELLRDSLSYTVTDGGHIIFSSQDFTTIFRTITDYPNAGSSDTLIITEQMGFKDSTITVPAGTFVTSTFRQEYHFPASYTLGSPRDYDYKYAKGIGQVSATIGFYSIEPYIYERRLVSYHVQ